MTELRQTRPCPRCGTAGGHGYCPSCHGPRTEGPEEVNCEVNRVVGHCGECGTDVVRLADDENMASCACGKASIPMAFVDANRSLAPTRPRRCVDKFPVTTLFGSEEEPTDDVE